MAPRKLAPALLLLAATLGASLALATNTPGGGYRNPTAIATAAQTGLSTATATSGGAGNAGKVLALDGNGKADGRILSADGTKLDALPASLASPGTIGGTTPAAITGTVVTASSQFTGAATGLTGIPGANITGNIPVAAIATALTTPGTIGGGTPAAGTFTNLTQAAGAYSLDTSNGTGAQKIGAASATLGFFAVTAVARAAAYTQTYATAARTVPADTSHTITDSSGGTASTSTLAAQSVTVGGAVDPTAALAADVNAVLVVLRNNIATINAELTLTKADALASKKLINALIDDSQGYGLAQ